MKFALPGTIGAFAAVASAASNSSLSISHQNNSSTIRKNIDTSVLVDLGYARHFATDHNVNAHYYLFKNIRYSEAPINEFRFQKPRSPSKKLIAVPRDGTEEDFICPQAIPNWSFRTPSDSAAENEDCLFLDVYATDSVLDATVNPVNITAPKPLAPVIVFFHDGGFVSGSKNDFSPVQLMANASARGQAAVLVAFNYRLGLFGWLQAQPGTHDKVSNAGLWDQRFALEWVQKYISLFGGDPDRVTALGELSGAASIVHHITGFSGMKAPLFSRAIVLNPTWDMYPDNSILKHTLDVAEFLNGQNVDKVEDLDTVDFDDLQEANRRIVSDSPRARYTFGPVMDTSFVSSQPWAVLREGLSRSSLKFVVGHDVDTLPEGFDSLPEVKNQDQLGEQLRRFFPGLGDLQLNHLWEKLYRHNDSQTEPQRLRQILHETLIACNSYALARASPDHAYKYVLKRFADSDKLVTHTPYHLFGDDFGPQSIADYTATESPNARLLSFALTGSPNSERVSFKWKPFGKDGRNEAVFGLKAAPYLDTTKDWNFEKRCQWWMLLHGRPEKERDVKDLFRREREDRKFDKSASSRLRGTVHGVVLTALVVGGMMV